MDITCVTIDANDPLSEADFRNEALGWAGVEPVDDGRAAVCRPPDGGTDIEVVPVPEHKMLENRVHLGCSAGAIEALDAEVARLVALGATIAWEEQFPPEIGTRYRNMVLRDPERNEFCLGAGSMP